MVPGGSSCPEPVDTACERADRWIGHLLILPSTPHFCTEEESQDHRQWPGKRAIITLYMKLPPWFVSKIYIFFLPLLCYLSLLTVCNTDFFFNLICHPSLINVLLTGHISLSLQIPGRCSITSHRQIERLLERRNTAVDHQHLMFSCL